MIVRGVPMRSFHPRFSQLLRLIAVASGLLLGVLLLSFNATAQTGNRSTQGVRTWRIKSKLILASPDVFQMVKRGRIRFLCRARPKGRIQIRRIVRLTKRGKIVLVRTTTKRAGRKVRPLCVAAFESLVPGEPTPTATPTPLPTPVPGAPSLAGVLSITSPPRLATFYGQALNAVHFTGTCNSNSGTIQITPGAVTAECSTSGLWSAFVNLSSASVGFHDITVTQHQSSQGRRILVRPSAPCSTTTSGIISVRSASELEALRTTSSLSTGETFIVDLCANIDLSGREWEPLPTFTRVFDGNGFTISNLHVPAIAPAQNNAGLFKQVNGVVRNLSIENAVVNGGQNVGILAGGVSGDLINIFVSGQVRGANNAGGVFGSGLATLEDIRAEVLVEPPTSLIGRQIGGVAGACIFCEATKVNATGAVYGTSRVGGLFGLFRSSNLSLSYSEAVVSSDLPSPFPSIPNEATGGLIGLSQLSLVKRSYAEGEVATTAIPQFKGTGGLIGVAEASEIKDSYSIGAVAGSQDTSGLIGLVRPFLENMVVNSRTRIETSYAAGAVTLSSSPEPHGGLVGTLSSLPAAVGELDIQHSFFLKSSNPNATQGGSGTSAGVGVSAQQLSTPSTVDAFSPLIWNVGGGRFPRLISLPNQVVLTR